MVVINDFFNKVIDVKFCSTVDNGLHFVEQLIERKSKRFSDIIECKLLVDALNNLHFDDTFLGNSTHAQFFGALNTVFFAILFNQIEELFAVTFGLSCTDSLYLL